MKDTKKKGTPKFTSYQILVVTILTLLQFTIVIDFSIISPLGDMLMKELTIDPLQFGTLVACYAFGAGISGFLATAFADKFDRRKFLLFFYAGFILGTLICGLSDSYHMLMIARSVTGLFGGVIGSISLAIVTDLFALNQRGRVMGYIQMAFAGSQIMGIPIGILLANYWGWNSTFMMIVVLSTAIGILIFFKLRPINEHLKLQVQQDNPFRRFWNILSNRNYLMGFTLIAITSIGGSMLMPFGSAFLINNVGITQDELPLVYLFTGMATIFIMPMVGKISDRVDRFKVFTVGAIVTVIATLAYTNLPVAPLWIVVVVNVVLFTGISSRMIPASSLNTAIPEAKDRGAYMSLCSSLQQVSNGIAATVAGLIIVQSTKTSPIENYNSLGLVVVILTVACIFLIYRINKNVLAKSQ